MKIIRVSILGILFFFSSAVTQAEAPVEKIVSFDSEIQVQKDNSLDIREIIRYETGPVEHHGIFRNIITRSSTGQKMKINAVQVSDRYGTAIPFTTSTLSQDVFQIKIGDPKTTFTGEKEYIIRYSATQAVAQLESFDEVYWNATGDDWPFPIADAKVTLILPARAEALSVSCYQGARGSTEKCEWSKEEENLYVFNGPPEGLSPATGLTVALSFPKGLVESYPPTSKIVAFLTALLRKLEPFFAAFLVLFTFFVSFRFWYRNGRDPKGKGVYPVQYDVPDNLSPMGASVIMSIQPSQESVTAEILDLARRGYITITRVEEKVLLFLSNSDFRITRTDKEGADLEIFQESLLKALFKSNEKTVDVSDLRGTFSRELDSVYVEAKNLVKEKGYYTHFSNESWSKLANENKIAILLILIIAAFSFLSQWIRWGSFLAGAILVSFIYLLPQKTQKGIETKEYLLGLKRYIKQAEKARLEFHNSPEKSVEHFEKLLPYALLFGVTDIWVKQFAGIYEQSQLYTMAAGGDMDGFVTSFNNSMATSSGSGGGGSVGGGGGGGGGGSW